MQAVAGLISAASVFAVLLVLSFKALNRLSGSSTTDSPKADTDHRVVHFTLRLALAFGIGAVIVGILLVAVLLIQALS